MTPHLGTASEKHLHPLISAMAALSKTTRQSFTGLPYSKLPPDVLSQISIVEMFIQSKLGRESCLNVLDKRVKPACWPQAQIAVHSHSIDPSQNVKSTNLDQEM